MSRKRKHIWGGSHQRFFDNPLVDPAGCLLNAGMELPAKLFDWWNMLDLWSYNYYGFAMPLSEEAGFYRDEDGLQCQISRGNFLLTFPGRKQHYGPSKNEDWGEIYVGFDGDIFRTAHKRGLVSVKQPVWRLDSPEIWIEKVQKLLRDSTQASARPLPQKHFYHAARFLALLLEMLDAASPVTDYSLGGDWFAEACKMLIADFRHKPDLEEIAASLGMGYHTFRLNFRQRAGVPPFQYREDYRFQVAVNYLKNMHYPCVGIASILGFSSLDHFSKQFKKRFQISPQQYRQLHRDKS